MAFDFASLDNTCLNVFGVPVTYAPQDYSGPQTITGIISPPPFAETNTPGTQIGTNIVYLFVRFASITPQPRVRDQITIDNILYKISKVAADSQGGAMLHLEKET